MRNCSFYFLIICFTLACKQKEKTLEDTLQKSVAWIWKQQSADGGWHSQTHAVLRDGKVLTPYILYQLVQIPAEEFTPDTAAVKRAAEFIISSMNASINEDSTTLIDYPNYSAAYALRVLHELNRDTSLQRIITHYLLDQQFTGHRGFSPDSLAFGGWGYGETDLKKGEHGHEDLSHTRRVTQALVEAGYLPDSLKPAILLFLTGAQRLPGDARLYEGCISRAAIPYDGGFVSSVVTLATNKSQPVFIQGAGYHYPSYATATCDGFLALHALGMKDTRAYTDATNWLRKNQSISTIDGLSKNDPEQWTYVMHYYHLSVRSEAMAIIEPEGSWRDSISGILINEQLPDGDYLNPIGGVNKEDDPLMATIFAIQAGNLVIRNKSVGAFR